MRDPFSRAARGVDEMAEREHVTCRTPITTTARVPHRYVARPLVAGKIQPPSVSAARLHMTRLVPWRGVRASLDVPGERGSAKAGLGAR